MTTGNGWQRILTRTFLITCCMGMLSACGGSTPSQSASSNANGTKGPVVSGTIAPLLPPDAKDKPPAPGSLGRGISTDGLPSMQPAKGVNVSVDTLFNEDIRDPIERSRRVETAVTELRRDLDATMPAIKRLVAIEKDIQLLTSQLQTLLSGEIPAPEMVPQEPVDVMPLESVTDDMIGTMDPVPHEADVAVTPPSSADPPGDPPQDAAAPPQNASSPGPIPLGPIVTAADTPAPAVSPQPEPVKTQVPPPVPAPAPPVDGTPKAVGIRLGEHAGKMRIVMDLTGPVTPRVDLDNMEKILVIELPGTVWTDAASRNFKNPLLQSLSTQPLDQKGGTRVIILLKKDSAILSQSVLKPGDGNAYHRLVIDLKNEAGGF